MVHGSDNLGTAMIGLRDKSWRLCGATLGGIALGLQLMLSTLGLVLAAAAADPVDALGGHALCLAGDSGAAQPAHPADGAPAGPAHSHGALCCLWHHVPGVQPVAALPVQPVAYALGSADDAGIAAAIPGPRRGPHNARAPPPLA